MKKILLNDYPDNISHRNFGPEVPAGTTLVTRRVPERRDLDADPRSDPISDLNSS